MKSNPSPPASPNSLRRNPLPNLETVRSNRSVQNVASGSKHILASSQQEEFLLGQYGESKDRHVEIDFDSMEHDINSAFEELAHGLVSLGETGKVDSALFGNIRSAYEFYKDHLPRPVPTFKEFAYDRIRKFLWVEDNGWAIGLFRSNLICEDTDEIGQVVLQAIRTCGIDFDQDLNTVSTAKLCELYSAADRFRDEVSYDSEAVGLYRSSGDYMDALITSLNGRLAVKYVESIRSELACNHSGRSHLRSRGGIILSHYESFVDSLKGERMPNGDPVQISDIVVLAINQLTPKERKKYFSLLHFQVLLSIGVDVICSREVRETDAQELLEEIKSQIRYRIGPWHEKEYLKTASLRDLGYALHLYLTSRDNCQLSGTLDRFRDGVKELVSELDLSNFDLSQLASDELSILRSLFHLKLDLILQRTCEQERLQVAAEPASDEQTPPTCLIFGMESGEDPTVFRARVRELALAREKDKIDKAVVAHPDQAQVRAAMASIESEIRSRIDQCKKQYQSAIALVPQSLVAQDLSEAVGEAVRLLYFEGAIVLRDLAFFGLRLEGRRVLSNFRQIALRQSFSVGTSDEKLDLKEKSKKVENLVFQSVQKGIIYLPGLFSILEEQAQKNPELGGQLNLAIAEQGAYPAVVLSEFFADFIKAINNEDRDRSARHYLVLQNRLLSCPTSEIASRYADIPEEAHSVFRETYGIDFILEDNEIRFLKVTS